MDGFTLISHLISRFVVDLYPKVNIIVISSVFMCCLDLTSFPTFFSVILERCMVAEGSLMLTYTVLTQCHVPVNQSVNRGAARHLLNNSVL